MRPATAADVHTPRMRQAGRDLLSLGLMDARNLSLRWLALFESANALRPAEAPYGVNTPAWELGHIAWFQEHWIARNVQRQRGPAAGPQLPRLASIDPHADRRFDPSQSSAEARRQLDLPDGTGLRQYLAETIETTLELLESADETDDALYVFRLALLHEDLRAEALATTAQALGVAVGPRGADAGGVLPDIATLAPRAPLLFPATRWSLGTLPGGFVFEAEKWAHEIRVPEFEIDAQPVTWAQYAEFVEDGGYDEPRWWSAAGWRRPPRAAPRRPDPPGRAAAPLRPAGAGAAGAAGAARQRARGRGLVPLGRPPPADRGRMGPGRPRRRVARLPARRGVGMDGVDAAPVPGSCARPLEPTAGRRLGPPPGAARRLVRDPAAAARPGLPPRRRARAGRPVQRVPELSGLTAV